MPDIEEDPYTDEVGRKLIAGCRAALGDEGKRFIPSIAPKLYRFVGEVEETVLGNSPVIAKNLTGATAQRGGNDQILVSGIENVAELMRDSFIEMPMMDQLGKVYEAQHINEHSDYIRCSIRLIARCLLAAGQPESDLPDLIHYTAEFKTLEHPIYCRCLSVTAPAVSMDAMTCTVLHLETGAEFKAKSIPVRSRHASSGTEWLVFFDPVLPAQTGPYRIDVQYLVPGFLNALKETGKDELTLYLRRVRGKKVTVDFVLYAPASFRRIVMLPKKGPSPGRPMNPRELMGYGPPPRGFKAMGWTDMQPDEGVDYGVDLSCE